MTPLHLTLTRSRAIRAAFGVDTFTFDWGTAAGDAQLIAVVGVNGAGKTTLLDTLPWLTRPSKDPRYCPGAADGRFSLADEFYGPTAGWKIRWRAADGAVYESEIVIRIGNKTAKTEATLFRCEGDTRHPVVLPDHTASDGKVSTYQACLEHLLGPQDVYFRTAYAAQGQEPLSRTKTGDMKELLVNLMGLNAIIQQGERAGGVLKELRGRREALAAELRDIDLTAADLEDAETSLSEASQRQNTYTMFRDSARAALREAERQLAQRRAEAEQHAETDAKRLELNERRSVLWLERERQESDLRSDAQQETQRRIQLDHKHEKAARQINNQIQDWLHRIAEHQKLLDGRTRIEAAAVQAETLARDLANEQARLPEARVAAERFRDLKSRLKTIDATLAGLKREGGAARGAYESLTQRACLIDEVPCRGTDLQGRCQLLAEANEAKSRIPAVAEDLEAKRTAFKEAEQQRDATAATLDGMGHPLTELSNLENEIARLQRQLDGERAIAAALPRLDMAEQSVRDAQTEIERLNADRDAQAAEHQTEHAAIVQRIETLEARIKESNKRYNDEIDRLNVQIMALPQPGDDTAILEAEAWARDAEERVNYEQTRIEAELALIGQHRARIQTLQQRLRTAPDTRRQASRLDEEIRLWDLLARGLGSKQGVPVLLMDEAGPRLAEIANDLLAASYGRRYALEINTQGMTKGGASKETLDILVYDADRAEEPARSVRTLSGGQRVWVEQTLRYAMTVLRAEQSGGRYGTLYQDEVDGALDAGARLAFTQMKRRALELAGYEREIFVSHDPAVAGLADVVVDLGEVTA